MGAVHVGVRHDDDLAVAQVVVAVARAGAAAERLQRDRRAAGSASSFSRPGAGDVEDLSAQRQDRLGAAVARLLGGAAGRIALDDEELGVLARGGAAIGELAGQPQLARGGLARDLLLAPAARAAPRRARSPSRAAGSPAVGEAASQWSKASRMAFSTMRIASTLASRSLVWPTNSGSRMKTESMAPQEVMMSSEVMTAARLLPVSSA